MSRFRAVVQALSGPLEFARAHPERGERLASALSVLEAQLRQGSELRIPPVARRRFGAALEALATGALDGVAERVAPLLESDFPERALAQIPSRLPGVGPKTEAALARRDVRSIEDLLFLLPRSYEDRRDLVSIEALQVGRPACFEARVVRSATIPLQGGRRTVFQVVVSDGTAAVQLKWFRGAAYFADRLRPGVRLLVAGEVRRFRYAKELHHPEIEVLPDEAPVASLPRIVPVYPGVEGVPPRTLRRIVESALEYAADLVDAHLPAAAAAALELPPVGEALAEVHVPGLRLHPDELRERRTPYHLRLVAEELLLLQTGLELRRRALRRQTSLPLASRSEPVGEALASLPFRLTADQARAWEEIAADLAEPHPMNRLLLGDVGTGKTVLAFLASVAAHAAGGLSVVLAPTELLAEQHLATFSAFAAPLGLRVALLTGSTPAPQRREVSRQLRHGELSLLVGTHALLTRSLALPRLRLVVIDEQHRFGVAQRAALGAKGERPHLLVMSATPIPRTLALTVFGDLDHSTLRERPPGRAPVETRVVPPGERGRVLGEVRRTLERGEQVYVVYPLVEESAKQDLLDATRGFERLGKALPGVKLALIHGRLDARERMQAMARFAAGELGLLVSTTVIEVGVDVPNATLLVVQNAERFGLAQLHQLRGRVGRGNRPGRALLIGDPQGEDASRRLSILEATESGFEVAEEDLRIRGAGEWLGTRQAGHLPELRLADLVRHADLLGQLKGVAARLVAGDPELAAHTALRRAIERRWGRRLDLAGVA